MEKTSVNAPCFLSDTDDPGRIPPRAQVSLPDELHSVNPLQPFTQQSPKKAEINTLKTRNQAQEQSVKGFSHPPYSNTKGYGAVTLPVV